MKLFSHFRYFYACEAIDNFIGSIPIKSIFDGECTELFFDGLPHEIMMHVIKGMVDFANVWHRCGGEKGLLNPECTRYEGDFRDGEIYVFYIPSTACDDLLNLLGVVWKQENNGFTFVSSPVELPTLKKYEL